jgi:hypothetical protein
MDQEAAFATGVLPGIPLLSSILKTGSIKGSSAVKPQDFTSDLPIRLRALYTQ